MQTKLPRTYAEQTYASPYTVIRFPHEMRFRTATALIASYAPASLLDYGAGDGHLFHELARRNIKPPRQIVAYEPVASMADRLKEALGTLSGSSASVVATLEDLGSRTFDFIVCFGVLEHMPLLERYKFYEVCRRHLNPTGVCLIDVPVEIGPTLIVKHLGRVFLKRRSPEYGLRELMRIACLGHVFDPARFDPTSASTWIHSHKGFDYRLLKRELEAQFHIVQQLVSPLPLLFPWCFNQEAYFLIRHRNERNSPS